MADHTEQQTLNGLVTADASASQTAMIRASDIHKTFKEHVAVAGVSLDVAKGEVVSIIGPSGSGKSTFLRCINFLETPTSGVVELDGFTYDSAKSIKRNQLVQLRRTVGMVFQSFNLFPHMTVLRNISLPQQRVLGRSRDEADERSRELLKTVNLSEKAASYPGKCSGGQQQRIAIARALALDPKIMLFDEPTSALDPELGVEVLSVMRRLAEAGMTMIAVTHEMHFAADVSDRVVMMSDGVIIEQGESKSVLSNPTHERTQRFLRAVLDR
jgi:polar amino acid transport system ATP-binding protein